MTVARFPLGRMRLSAPLLVLVPSLVLPPLLLLLPARLHGGGFDLLGQFLLAALQPSLDSQVLGSLLEGLAVTVGLALLGWATSLLLGVLLGISSARIVWSTTCGVTWPAQLIRRLLAVPRSIHELIWGLLLLQVVGLQPAVAVAAIALPYGALVARVVSDLLDALPRAPLEALRAGGASAGPALATALGPALLPGLLSYGGYRLECALRSATLLGVFGLGGLGTELKLTAQSLQFQELWSGLWLLLGVMLLLEAAVGLLRRRWGMPGRLQLSAPGVGLHGRELVLVTLLLVPVLLAVGRGLGVEPLHLLAWQPLPSLTDHWPEVLALPWLELVGSTLGLTLLAAALAVGLAPLLLLLVAPWPWGRRLLQLIWAFGRLLPPPLTALLLLFVLQPGVITASLALGFHNLGILGRLLVESAESTVAGGRAREEALGLSGAGPRLSLLYGRFSSLARTYLAYGAYRTDVILRETVVVGLVGASGLGSQLQESLSAFAWHQVLALLAAYATLTLLGEDLSDRLRRRLLNR